MKMKKRFLSILLSLVMVLGLLPGMSLTAYAVSQISIETKPTAGEITYGQTLADSTLTGGTANVAGTFAWKNKNIAPAVSDSDTTEYDVVFTATQDGNYTAECKVKLFVNKADPAYTVGQLSAFRGQTLADVTSPRRITVRGAGWGTQALR